MFYFYNYIGKDSYLKKLFILAPRIPYIHKTGVKFVDFLPVSLVYDRVKASLIELISTVNKEFYKVKRSYLFDENRVISDDAEVELSLYKKGFEIIRFKDIVLKRREI